MTLDDLLGSAGELSPRYGLLHMMKSLSLTLKSQHSRECFLSCPLSDRHEFPDSWRRDIETEGLPTTRIERNTVGVLGYRAGDRVLVMEEDFNLAQLYAAVARNCLLHPESFEVITPAIHPHQVELRGRRPEWLKGVKSVEDEEHFGIFIDPRDLGQPLVFVTVPPHGNTLDSICGIAGIQLPQGWRIRVEGAIFYGETTGIIGLRQGSSVRLSVIPYGERDRHQMTVEREA